MTRPASNASLRAAWRCRWSVCALVAVTALVATAHAHDLPRERTALVQVSDDAVEVMIVYLEPPSARVELLIRRFDLDGDGELRGPEARLAGGEWIRRVLYGLQFEVEGERPRAREPEIKFRREDRGSLSAAMYARWDLEPLGPGEDRDVHVRLVNAPDNVPTEITFQSDEDTDIVGVDLPARFGGAPVRPLIRPGEEARARVVRTADDATSSQ